MNQQKFKALCEKHFGPGSHLTAGVFKAIDERLTAHDAMVKRLANTDESKKMIKNLSAYQETQARMLTKCEKVKRAENRALGVINKRGCGARQHGDQMLCPCGLAWDVNDPDPPACARRAA